jgi:hypothetical protein
MVARTKHAHACGMHHYVRIQALTYTYRTPAPPHHEIVLQLLSAAQHTTSLFGWLVADG